MCRGTAVCGPTPIILLYMRPLVVNERMQKGRCLYGTHLDQRPRLICTTSANNHLAPDLTTLCPGPIAELRALTQN